MAPAANPDAVLQFRSHSFQDPAVRRHFLQRFSDAGIAPHQLQPLPYAPSSAEAMADFGRIHLHLDSYPVVVPPPLWIRYGNPCAHLSKPFYAGAISAAILQHAGLVDHIARTRHSCQRTLAGWQIVIGLQARRDLAYRYGNHLFVIRKLCLTCLSNSFCRCFSERAV